MQIGPMTLDSAIPPMAGSSGQPAGPAADDLRRRTMVRALVPSHDGRRTASGQRGVPAAARQRRVRGPGGRLVVGSSGGTVDLFIRGLRDLDGSHPWMHGLERDSSVDG
jgi:hypothetical protein